MNPHDATTGSRDEALDGIRGIAILLVLVFHCYGLPARGQPSLFWFNALTESLWLGVDLFFVLSGFLITRILIQTRDDPHYFRNFYARRALRIFPAYYLVLAVVLLVLPRLNDTVAAAQLDRWQWWFVFYGQNIAIVSEQMRLFPWEGVNHFWSLAVEEQFYLIWPLLVYATPRKLLSRMCLSVIALSWIGKAWVAGLDVWHLTGYFFTLTRLDALVAGAWVAVHVSNTPATATPLRIPPIAWLAVGAVAVLAFVLCQGFTLRHSAIEIALVTSAAAVIFAAWIFQCVRSPQPTGGWLTCRFLTFYGKYAYGLYLVHWPITILAKPLFAAEWKAVFDPLLGVLLAGSLLTVVSTALAVVMFHRFEAPILHLKRYFPATGGPALPSQAADTPGKSP